MFNPNSAFMPMRSLAPVAKKTIDWAGLLSNTQKTLNIVNQAIPIVYQAKPIIKNAKTMFRVASAFTKSDNKQIASVNNTTTTNNKSNLSSSNNYQSNDSYNYDDNQPSFFI